MPAAIPDKLIRCVIHDLIQSPADLLTTGYQELKCSCAAGVTKHPFNIRPIGILNEWRAENTMPAQRMCQFARETVDPIMTPDT